MSLMVGISGAITTVMAQRLVLNIRHKCNPTSVNTTQGRLATWLIPEWPNAAEIEWEREGEVDHIFGFTENEVAVERIPGGSNTDLVISP